MYSLIECSIGESQLCIMEYCSSVNVDPDPFYSLDVQLYRRHFNVVTCSFIAITASLFILFVAIGTYDFIRTKIASLCKQSVSKFL